MTLSEAVSIRIDELMKERKMTQYRLSILSGVSQSTIGDIRWQRNKSVNLRIIYEIAQGFKMDLIQFFNSPVFEGENITD